MTSHSIPPANRDLPPVLRMSGSAPQEDSVSAVLTDFFRAQKQEFALARRLAEDVSVLLVDDDYSLVNSFFIVENVDLITEPTMLGDIAVKAGLDPARTEMVVPGVIAPQLVRDCQRKMRGIVRRVVRLTDFLDGFLRTDQICAALKNAGVDEPNSPNGLL